MIERAFPSMSERGSGAFWSMPAVHFITTSSAVNLTTTPVEDARGAKHKYARAITANVDLTITLYPVGSEGGSGALITLKTGQRTDKFFGRWSAPSAGTVTIDF